MKESTCISIFIFTLMILLWSLTSILILLSTNSDSEGFNQKKEIVKIMKCLDKIDRSTELLHVDLIRMNERIDQYIVQSNARNDQLYSMFIELLKDDRK